MGMRYLSINWRTVKAWMKLTKKLMKCVRNWIGVGLSVFDSFTILMLVIVSAQATKAIRWQNSKIIKHQNTIFTKLTLSTSVL